MLNTEKRAPEPFLQGFKPEFTKHPVFYIRICHNGLYNRCAKEQGTGEIFVFLPAPILTSNLQDYL
jgi:hypothetical protein